MLPLCREEKIGRRFRAFERTSVAGGHHSLAFGLGEMRTLIRHHSVAGQFRRSSAAPVADNGVQPHAGTHDQVVDCRNDGAARRERVQAGARSEMPVLGK
jgi:hypothetical protein